MNRFVTICAATAIAFIATACNLAHDSHDADVKAIQDGEAQWNRDFASRDADKLIAHYADDAVFMGPGAPPSSGRNAIRVTVKEMVADPAMSLELHPVKIDVAKSGDMAYTQGSYTMAMIDPQSRQIVHDHGSYVTTYRKQSDGRWKAVADIATSEVPVPAPASAH